MTPGIKAKQRVEFPKSKESQLLAILLLGIGILPFFLNYGLFYKLKNTLPFEFDGKVLFSVPGNLEIANFRIRGQAFTLTSKSLTLRYHPLEYLKTGVARFQMEGREASLSLSRSIFNTNLPRIDFEAVEGVLHAGRECGDCVSIDYFSARGKNMQAYSGGKFSGKEMGLALSCYLTPDLLAALPFSLAKHLFIKPKAPLYEFKFVAQGPWKEPIFNLSSDLVRVEMKTR